MALVSDTLSNLRSQLSKRLGFGTQGDTAGPFQDLLTAFLTDAHEQLFYQYEFPELRRDWIFPLVIGQTLYALPVDSDGRKPDPERIVGIYVQVNNAWSHLPRGIDPTLYTITTSGIPSRYDIAHGNVESDQLPVTAANTNLLANPNNWVDQDGVSPPAAWNGTSYVYHYVGGQPTTQWQLNPKTGLVPADGDVIAAQVVSTAVPDYWFVNGASGGVPYDWFAPAGDYGPNDFSTSLAASDAVFGLVPGALQNASSYSFVLTPLASTPSPPVFGSDDPILELWQSPAAVYNLRIRAYTQSTAFAADTDKTLVDSRLVFLMALANAKAHYGQPDANAIAGQLQMRLRKLRVRLHNDATYRRDDDRTPPPQPKIANPDAFD